ncbi:hypothetical protein EVAR_36620_1, partial [Eumeta japonica]
MSQKRRSVDARAPPGQRGPSRKYRPNAFRAVSLIAPRWGAILETTATEVNEVIGRWAVQAPPPLAPAACARRLRQVVDRAVGALRHARSPLMRWLT